MPMNARLLRPRAAVSTGFDPRSIGTMLGWWDASDASTVTLVDGFVSQWNDKSGNGRNVSQATEAARPSVGTVNSRSAIYFDGSNDWLTGTGVSPAGTLILAVRPNRTGNETYFYNGVTTPAINVVAIGTGANAAVGSERRTASGFSHRQSSVGATVGATNICSATVFSEPPGLLRVNGVAGTTSASTSFGIIGNSAVLAFGGSSSNGVLARPFQGHICEVLFYAAELSAVAIAAAEQYLAAKWGVTLVTPPTASNADAQDWLNRVYDNGGTVSSTTAAAVNTFCEAIDSAGIRDRFYRLNLFCGDQLAAALVPLYRGPVAGGTVFGGTNDASVSLVSGDYTATGSGRGMRGGTGKAVNTGLTHPTIAPLLSNHHLAACTASTWPSTSVLMGYDNFVTSAPNGIYFRLRSLSGSAGFQASQTDTNILAASPASPALWIGTADNGSLALYSGGASRAAGSQTQPVTDTAGPVASLYVLGTRRQSGSAPSDAMPNTAPLCAYSMGVSMTAAQAAAYNDAMKSFQSALGQTIA